MNETISAGTAASKPTAKNPSNTYCHGRLTSSSRMRGLDPTARARTSSPPGEIRDQGGDGVKNDPLIDCGSAAAMRGARRDTIGPRFLASVSCGRQVCGRQEI